MDQIEVSTTRNGHLETSINFLRQMCSSTDLLTAEIKRQSLPHIQVVIRSFLNQSDYDGATINCSHEELLSWILSVGRDETDTIELVESLKDLPDIVVEILKERPSLSSKCLLDLSSLLSILTISCGNGSKVVIAQDDLSDGQTNFCATISENLKNSSSALSAGASAATTMNVILMEAITGIIYHLVCDESSLQTLLVIPAFRDTMSVILSR
jgi:hypothetical protein